MREQGNKISAGAARLLAVALLPLALAFAALVGADSAAAQVRLILPQTVRADVPLRAEVRAPARTDRVAFFVDGKALGVVRRPAWRLPHRARPRLKAGKHSVSVRVRRGKRTFEQTRTVEVVLPTVTETPAAEETSPSRGGKPKPATPPVKTTPPAPQPVVPAPSTSIPEPTPESPAPPTGPEPPTTPTAPTTPTTPTPPPSGQTLLFRSDFTQNLRGWSLGGVGEVIPQVIQSAEGPYCEFTLTGTQGRSELIMGDSLHIVEGETVLYEFEEFIVPGFAYGSRSLGWNLFTQFKSDGEGSPMLGLDLWNDGGKKGLWVETDTGHGVYYAAPMAEGVWHRVAMRITASSQGRGGWNIYLDGQEVDSKTGVSTIRPGKTFAYIKNGLYRSGPTINATGKLRMRNASLLALG